MKKTASILLLLSSILSAAISAQPNDSLQSKLDRSYCYLSFRPGLIAGYQFFSSDSADMTLSQPNEFHFRFYPRGSKVVFYDTEIQLNSLLLQQHYLAKGAALRLGAGMVSRNYNYTWRLHLGYQRLNIDQKRTDYLKYEQMIIFGYSFESNGIPLTIDYWLPIQGGVKIDATFLLMGLKIPILLIDFNKIEEWLKMRRKSREK